MRRQFASEGRFRRCRPAVEGLESRDLLAHIVPTAAHRVASGLPNPAVIQQTVQLLYGPDSQTPMNPTPPEIRRQIFVARWVGQYTVGPPRFSDRSTTIHAYGVSGGSNQFLKGKFDLTLFPPSDPTATPTPGDPYADEVTGVAGLFPQNILQSGTTLALDLNGVSSAGSGPLDLPTHLSWTYDSNTSAGAYAAPTGFDQGAGTLDIKWMPDARPDRRNDGLGQSDRHVPGTHQHEWTRESGLQVDFVAVGRRAIVNTQIKNATPTAQRSDVGRRPGNNKMRGGV